MICTAVLHRLGGPDPASYWMPAQPPPEHFPDAADYDQLSHIRKRLLEERARALTDVNRSQADAAEGEMESTGDLSSITDNADQATQIEDEEPGCDACRAGDRGDRED